MKLPKLITTTKEGRRVYPIKLLVNDLELNEIVIDLHFEEKHPYMSDEKIYRIVKFLNNKSFIPTNRKNQYVYFETDIRYHDKNHRLVWCLEDNQDYLEVIDCYRASNYEKNKKDHEKQKSKK